MTERRLNGDSTTTARRRAPRLCGTLRRWQRSALRSRQAPGPRGAQAVGARERGPPCANTRRASPARRARDAQRRLDREACNSPGKPDNETLNLALNARHRRHDPPPTPNSPLGATQPASAAAASGPRPLNAEPQSRQKPGILAQSLPRPPHLHPPVPWPVQGSGFRWSFLPEGPVALLHEVWEQNQGRLRVLGLGFHT